MTDIWKKRRWIRCGGERNRGNGKQGMGWKEGKGKRGMGGGSGGEEKVEGKGRWEWREEKVEGKVKRGLLKTFYFGQLLVFLKNVNR